MQLELANCYDDEQDTESQHHKGPGERTGKRSDHGRFLLGVARVAPVEMPPSISMICPVM